MVVWLHAFSLFLCIRLFCFVLFFWCYSLFFFRFEIVLKLLACFFVHIRCSFSCGAFTDFYVPCLCSASCSYVRVFLWFVFHVICFAFARFLFASGFIHSFVHLFVFFCPLPFYTSPGEGGSAARPHGDSVGHRNAARLPRDHHRLARARCQVSLHLQ